MEHWNDVVESLGPPLLRTAMRIVGNSTDAEDLVQTAFLEAYRLNQKQAVTNWHALLRKIVTNRAYDLLRKKHRHQLDANAMDLASDATNPLDQLAVKELIEQLQTALCRLPKQQARVFWLRHFDQCSNDEIADSLGISSHGVAVALNKARTALAPEFVKGERGE